MEVLTGPALLHATDVVAVNHGAGKIVCSNFNLVANRTFSGPAKACIRLNGTSTEFFMLQHTQGTSFEFPGGSLVPEHGVLAGLPLSFGMNTLEFHMASEGSSGEGVTACAALWLWKASDRVVVVDIDGTITKSDVRGLLANQVQGTASFLSNALASSNPWTSEAIMNTARSADYNHEGVADAISYIAQRGYRILYLTARPISMAAGSRTYLGSVSQSPGSKLPDGALITQPHGTMKALTTKHDEFKISVLAQIQHLFEADTFSSIFGSPGNGRSVFAGGFGNSDTDVVAYDEAGIPRTHIFVADKSSRIKNLEAGDEYQSYTGLLPHLGRFFPGSDEHPYAVPSQSRPLTSAHRVPSSENLDTSLLSHVTSKLEDILPLRKSPVSPPRSWGGPESQLEKPQQPASSPTVADGDKAWSARRLMESLVPGCSGPRMVSEQEQQELAGGGAAGERRVQGQDLFEVKGGARGATGFQPPSHSVLGHGPAQHGGAGGGGGGGSHTRYAAYSSHDSSASTSGQYASSQPPQRSYQGPPGYGAQAQHSQGFRPVQHSSGQQYQHSSGQQYQHSSGQQYQHSSGQQYQHSSGQQYQHSSGQQYQQQGSGHYAGGSHASYQQQSVPNRAPAQPEAHAEWLRQQRQQTVARSAMLTGAGRAEGGEALYQGRPGQYGAGGAGPGGQYGAGGQGGGRGRGRTEMVNVLYTL